MVLQHYPLQHDDLVLDSSRYSSNTLLCMDLVRCKRVCIKFPDIWIMQIQNSAQKVTSNLIAVRTQMLDFMTFLTTVLYLHDPIPGNLMQSLLHLILYMQRVCLTNVYMRLTWYTLATGGNVGCKMVVFQHYPM